MCSRRWTPWVSNQLETTAAVCTHSLSQSKNHCWDIIYGLFSCKFYTPWAAGRDLVSIRRSSATVAATEAMRIAVHTVSLRIKWRAPCLLNNSVSLQRTQALVPVGSFHCFFISVKLLPALARSATKSRTLVILSCVGGAAHYFLWFGLPEHS